jgi:hypothetical protein
MTPISTKIHGLFDYLASVFLILSPWLFGFSNGFAETIVPVAAGSFMFMYSLCTHYEMGMIRFFYMRTHLVFDMVTGIFLAVSPLVFRFYQTVYMPHLWLGIGLVLMALISSRRPYARRNPHGDMTKYFLHIPKQYNS